MAAKLATPSLMVELRGLDPGPRARYARAMADIGTSSARGDYLDRIERSKRWVEARLGSSVSLDDMAAAAAFSKYHFHRIFTAIEGESPAAYLRRLRLEHAANLLERRPDEPVTSVAMDCGFATPSAFARDFKARFGMSPRAFRARPGAVRDTARAPRAGNATPSEAFSFGFANGERLRLAEARGEGRYDRAAERAWSRLMGAWFRSGRKALPDAVYGVAWDNPEITPESKCRYSACAALRPDEPVPRGLFELVLPSGGYLVLTFDGKIVDYSDAYRRLYGAALPDSGYYPADSPCFERYLSFADGARGIVELWLPLA
ncbi:MAG: AraC family transcriptional regulator [Spirochaetaceae bacterium]|nr:AraC family transcriptional regulator [Spirochaetaceae bacterium]